MVHTRKTFYRDTPSPIRGHGGQRGNRGNQRGCRGNTHRGAQPSPGPDVQQLPTKPSASSGAGNTPPPPQNPISPTSGVSWAAVTAGKISTPKLGEIPPAKSPEQKDQSLQTSINTTGGSGAITVAADSSAGISSQWEESTATSQNVEHVDSPRLDPATEELLQQDTHHQLQAPTDVSEETLVEVKNTTDPGNESASGDSKKSTDQLFVTGDETFHKKGP